MSLHDELYQKSKKELVNDIYNHSANFGYDNETDSFSLIVYCKSELNDLEKNDLVNILLEYMGE